MQQEQNQKQLRLLLTVNQFSKRNIAFSEPALRNLIFNAFTRKIGKTLVEGNGLDKAILKVGRKVLIDETKFFEWLDERQKKD